MLKENVLTTGHAKVILSLKDKTEQLKLAHLIKQKGLTVRETEAVLKQWEGTKETSKKEKQKAGSQIENRETEERLQQILATKVKLKQGRKSGCIEIYYYSPEERERILAVLLSK